MVLFNIYRNDSDELATDFDMGDLEFVFGDQVVSSRGNPRLSNMIYVSISDLIDGLLRLKERANRYEFVGTDSSFVLHFERCKQGIHVRHGKIRYGPVSLQDFLAGINFGVDNFLADPRNVLPAGGAGHADFNASRLALKEALLSAGAEKT